MKIFLTILMLSSLSVYADQTAITSDGKTVTLKSDGTYEIHGSNTAVDEPISIDIADLVLDSEQLSGKNIRTEGYFIASYTQGKIDRGSLYLRRSMVGPSLRVITTSLDRSDQMKILDMCTPMCSAVIVGNLLIERYGGLVIQASSVNPTGNVL